MKTVRIGTRKSKLALWQAQWVQTRLEQCHPGLHVELVKMDTKGDRNIDVPLPSVADKGFFTAEIEQALFDEDIDIAVHSLKDLPTELPSGLAVGAYCEREDAHDAFLGKDGMRFASLPEGACVGTSSLRRTAQLKRLRPDLVCLDLRGNLDTRWRKLQESEEMTGIILAAAGVRRLDWSDRISDLLPFDAVLPAPGQGVIAVECLDDRAEVLDTIAAINHIPSEFAARAERSFQSALGGGCQTPIGAIGTYEDGTVRLDVGVFSLDGADAVRAQASGESAVDVGRLAADKVLDQGAGAILSKILEQ